MNTIYKYELKVTDEQIVTFPSSPEFLSVQNQNGKITLWAYVDTEGKPVNIRIKIVGTGHPFEDRSKYFHMGTVQIGPLVWHVFTQWFEK